MKKFVWPILVLVLLMVSVFSLRSCYRLKKKSETEIKQLRQFLKPVPLKPTQVKKDHEGNTHYTFTPPVIATKADLLKSGFISKERADSLRKVIDAKDKEIYGITLAKLKIEAQLKSVLKTDTSGKTYAHAADSTFDISYYPDSNLFKVAASIKISGVNIVHKPFLGKPIIKTELWTNDRRAKLSEVYIITKPYENPKKKTGLKLTALAVLAAAGYLIFK